MSQLCASGGQNIGTSASASVLSMTIQGWFPLGLTVLISLLSKGFTRVFTTIWKDQFFGAQCSVQVRYLFFFFCYWLIGVPCIFWIAISHQTNGLKVFLLFCRLPFSLLFSLLCRSFSCPSFLCLLLFLVLHGKKSLLQPLLSIPSTLVFSGSFSFRSYF